MKDIIFNNFQDSVDNCLIRHRSILDVLTKYTESSSRINRCIAKAVTNCGCIQISAHDIPVRDRHCQDRATAKLDRRDLSKQRGRDIF